MNEELYRGKTKIIMFENNILIHFTKHLPKAYTLSYSI